MSKEEAATAAATPKADNQKKALDRVAAVMNKYKLIKAPVLISDVAKHVFGDLSANEDKADKAFTLISGLVNKLVDDGDLTAYQFVNASIEPGQTTPSIINETLLVLPSFQLVGYQPADFEAGDGAEDGDEVETDGADDLFNELEVSEVISRHAEAYGIVVTDKKGKQKPVIVRHSSEAALGKFLSVVADEETSAVMYAMIPISLEIKTSVEKSDSIVAETAEADEPATA